MAEYKVSSSEVMVTFRGLNAQDTTQDTTQDNIKRRILKYCSEPKSKKEIAAFLGYADEQGFAKRHLKPLLAEKMLAMTIPDKPNSKKQKYITVKK